MDVISEPPEIAYSSRVTTNYVTRLREQRGGPTVLINPHVSQPQYNTVCKQIDTAQGQLLDCRIQTKDSNFSTKPNFVPENCEPQSNDSWLQNTAASKHNFTQEHSETDSNQPWFSADGGSDQLVHKQCEDNSADMWLPHNNKSEYVQDTSEHETREYWMSNVSHVVCVTSENDNRPEWLPPANNTHVGAISKKESALIIRVSEDLKENDELLDVKPGRKRARRRKAIDCYKCQYCPLLSLKREMMVLHGERKGACVKDTVMVTCPGCTNVFYSTISLRVHLTHDHNMLPRDVKSMVVHLPHVKMSQITPELSKKSCLYETRTGVSENFNLENTEQGEDRLSCAKATPPSLIQSYLEISTKNNNNCSLPARIVTQQGGDEILENTFNFTAPVSEQLPSIQPENPPAASGLDKEHLIEESNLHNQRKIEEQVPDASTPHCSQPSHIISQTSDQIPDSVPINLESNQPIELLENNRQQDEYLNINIYNEEAYPVEEYEYLEETEISEIPVVCIEVEPGSRASSPPLPPVPLPPPPLPTVVFSTANQPHNQQENAADKKISCGFRCGINGCKLRMQSEDNIKYHRRCHEGQLYNCPECCKDSSHWEALSSHLWLKHRIDMELYKCDLCSYRTPKYSRLTSLHRGIHGTGRPYLCDVCGKGFKTCKQMRNHKDNAHKEVPDNMFECDICCRIYRHKRGLTKHYLLAHKSRPAFLCSECGYSTSRKDSLILHMRKHSGEKPHECDKCDYKSSDHNALRRHQLKHTGRLPYECQLCSYKCVQASSIKYHIKKMHPDEQESVIFSCEHCPFETIARAKYLTHVTTHTHFYTSDTSYYPSILPGESIVDLSNTPSILEGDYYEVDEVDEVDKVALSDLPDEDAMES